MDLIPFLSVKYLHCSIHLLTHSFIQVCHSLAHPFILLFPAGCIHQFPVSIHCFICWLTFHYLTKSSLFHWFIHPHVDTLSFHPAFYLWFTLLLFIDSLSPHTLIHSYSIHRFTLILFIGTINTLAYKAAHQKMVCFCFTILCWHAALHFLCICIKLLIKGHRNGIFKFIE